MTVTQIADARRVKQDRCALRGHRFGPDGKGTCQDCGLTVNR